MAVVGSASQGFDSLNVDGFEAFAAQELDVEDGINHESDTETVQGPTEDTLEADEEGAEEHTGADEADDSDADDVEASQSDDEEDTDAEAEGPEDADGDMDEFIEFDHPDGGKIRVSPSDYARGFLRQEDYSRKTAELSDNRQAHQNRVQEWEQTKDQELLFLQANAPQKPQWDADDPIGSTQAREEYNAAMEWRGAFLQQHQQRQAHVQAAYTAEQATILPRRIPEWATPEVAAREKAGVRQMLRSSGYSESEVDGVADSRAVVIARKAFLYDQLQAQRKTQTAVAKKKVAKTPPAPVRSAGPTPRPKGDPRKARLVKAHRQKGSAESMADILMADMTK